MSKIEPTTAADTTIPAWFSAAELEEAARHCLADDVFDFIAGGAGDERSLRANLMAFDRLRLRPRALVDVSDVSTETEILGSMLAAPIFVAPMGGQTLVHSDGERASASGAVAAGVGYIHSMTGSCTLQEVAAVAGSARWFQLYYMTSDRGLNRAILDQVAAAGYTTICITVDAAASGYRRRDLRHSAAGSKLLGRFSVAARYGLPDTGPGAARLDPSLSWRDIEWFLSATKLPIVLKGVMTAEDARIAADTGVAGVVVSNHGGRQLDNTFGTIEVVPEILAAVGGRLPVLMDGGVRRATDVAAALALGCSAVAIGRPVLWAMSIGGSRGVAIYLGNLVVELRSTMALLGARRVSELRPEHVSWVSG